MQELYEHALRILREHSMSGKQWDYTMELVSYAVSFGSFFLFVFVAKRAVASPSFDRSRSLFSRLAHSCVAETEYASEKAGSKAAEGSDAPAETFSAQAARLAVCALGIQVSYLLWGLMQERIMTQPYESGERFRSSKFLVFANRFLALLVAYAAVRHQNEPTDEVPLYKFSFASVSNIFSSVSQYEALKYVSFPTQVLAKSCKMVPVMLMGYLVSQRTYKPFEYLVAVAVTAGAMIFKLYETNDAPVQNTEFIGIVLIVAYMGCDSFTSNWQSKIFTQWAPRNSAQFGAILGAIRRNSAPVLTATSLAGTARRRS